MTRVTSPGHHHPAEVFPLIDLRAAPQEQQVHAGALELQHALGHGVRRADEPARGPRLDSVCASLFRVIAS
ncbi:hypothetical protein D7V97_22185 [Corallococcus sp. CA053C]|nr:hypothetical protein D7V97_22185 [Corallococcus sp. CA053C]